MSMDHDARAALSQLSRTVEELAERQGAMILRETKRVTVANRLIQALVVVHARQSGDAIRYIEDLKAIALDPVDDDLAEVKMELEKAFAFLQATALKPL